MRFPGLTPPDKPKVIGQQVLTVDLAPSLLELCGAPPLEKIHGKSWAKLVEGPAMVLGTHGLCGRGTA